MLREIADLEEGVILLTGDAKKVARAYVRAWLSRGKTLLAEWLPFRIEEFERSIFIGSPYEGFSFDAYLIINPLSRPKNELADWLKENMDKHKLILLYETKYVKDSITRYRIKEFIDYLIAYKRETAGFERIDVYKMEEGRVIKKKSYVRKI